MTYAVAAHNTATRSDNKIHDDAVARSYGFGGGLVPGVDIYAYLTHLPVARWGRAWLERGAITARFLRPVYDSERVTVDEEVSGDGGTLELTLRNPSGEVCATATAVYTGEGDPPSPDAIPMAALPAARPPASPATLAVGTVLGSLTFGFHAAHAGPYLDDVRETLPLYREAGIAHPGWLLRSANTILAANVALGPWIHVSSAVEHFGAACDGDALVTRARVVDGFERKGHRFVVLDVLVTDPGPRAILRAAHTAIYEPRRQS